MKAALASFIDRLPSIAIRQPDDLQSESFQLHEQGLLQGQPVYVLHKAVKRFGSLIMLNGSNHAVVIPDGGYSPVPFSFDQVLSM